MKDNVGISIKQYDNEDKKQWDEFIEKSKNGTFLHKIDYMHYHINRFKDCSLLIKKQNRLVAVMPGNIEESTYYTHKGLTYGGLLILPETKLTDVIIYFNHIHQYLKEEKQIQKVIYKSIPHIYSSIPSQEDEYVLFRLGAKWKSCGASSAIYMGERIPFVTSRKRGIKKAKNSSLKIKKDFNYEDFWEVLTDNLEKTHNSKPVHSIAEIQKLKNYFTEDIQLFSVYEKDECLAGAVMYITKNVAHIQYISASEKGKKVAALDFLFDYLINEVFAHVPYFDFGTSVEDNGHYLNEGLVYQKQGFGARCVLYQQFEYEIDRIIEIKGMI